MSYDGECHEDDCRCDACMKYADPGEPAAEVARLTARLEEAREALEFSPCTCLDHLCARCKFLAASSGVPGQERSRGTGWWEQYEETAARLHEAGDFTAADDIRTLVDGLREYEREARLGGANEPGEGPAS